MPVCWGLWVMPSAGAAASRKKRVFKAFDREKGTGIIPLPSFEKAVGISEFTSLRA